MQVWVLHRPRLDPVRLSYTWNLNSLQGSAWTWSRCPTQVSSRLRSQYGPQAGVTGCGMDSLNVPVCVLCTVSRVCPHLWLYKWSLCVGADRRVADVLPVVASFSLCSQTWGLATLMLKHSMHLGLYSSVRKAIVPFPKMKIPWNDCRRSRVVRLMCLCVWLQQALGMRPRPGTN